MKPDSQVRLILIQLHNRVAFWGPARNFFVLITLLFLFFIGADAVLYFCLPAFFSASAVPMIILTVLIFGLHKIYFIDLPQGKCMLAFFEQNHPEMCSWLEESAEIEARMMVQ